MKELSCHLSFCEKPVAPLLNRQGDGCIPAASFEPILGNVCLKVDLLMYEHLPTERSEPQYAEGAYPRATNFVF